MPIVRIPLADWIPDKGELNNPGLAQVYGAVPSPDGWAAPPIIVVKNQTDVTLATVTTARMYGFHIHSVTDTILTQPEFWFYAGSDDDLYRSNAADSLVLVPAKAVPGGFAPTVASGWQFCSYGNAVIATDFSSQIQYASTPSTNFTDMIQYTSPDTYRPQARFVSTIKQHALLGHIKFAAAPSVAVPRSALTSTSYPSLVMWSATDNIRRYGDPAGTASTSTIGSDWQDLSDEYGAITGISGGDFAYIFKERAIYLMEGPPFQFRRIVSGTGTLYPNSIARYYDDVYFWGDGGPMRLRAGSSTPERLGEGIVQKTLLNPNGPVYDTSQSDPDYPLFSPSQQYYMEKRLLGYTHVNTFCDYRGGYVVFTTLCKGVQDDVVVGGTGYYNTKMLIYHVDSGRFGWWSTERYSMMYPRTIASYNYTPPSVTAVHEYTAQNLISSATYGIDFNGTYFLTGSPFDNSPSAGTESINVGKFAYDAQLTTPSQFLYQDLQAPAFSLPYMTFPVSGGQEDEAFKASSIVKVRPIYSGERASISVNVKSVSRFPEDGQYIETEQLYTPSTDTYQDDNGWIYLNTPYATHHKITVIVLPDEESAVADGRANPLAYTSNLITLEIEYVMGDKAGSAYYA